LQLLLTGPIARRVLLRASANPIVQAGMAGIRTARTSLSTVALAAALVGAASGCASIVSGRHAEVAINSYPPDAQVSVRDSRGRMVATAQTPAVVSLKRGDGFLRKAQYTATIEKPGYSTAHVPIDSTVNPWVLGNVIFGGIPGLVVDPYTGAMWRPTPTAINEELQPSSRPGPEIYPASHSEAD
jgi:hypothetical protein